MKAEMKMQFDGMKMQCDEMKIQCDEMKVKCDEMTKLLIPVTVGILEILRVADVKEQWNLNEVVINLFQLYPHLHLSHMARLSSRKKKILQTLWLSGML